jgi:hypothetical protein
MLDLEGLIRIALAIAAIAGLVLTLRWLGAAEGGSLADLFRIPVDPPLPRAGHEEEPQRWHLERLGRPGTGDLRAAGAGAPRTVVDCSPRARVPLPD